MSEDFSITAMFNLDRESVSKAGRGLQNAMAGVAGNIANSFKGRLLAAVGAGGIAALLTKQLTSGFETLRDARKTGLGIEEFQTLKTIADQTGQSVEQLSKQYIQAKASGAEFAKSVGAAMNQLLQTGAIMTEADVAQMARAYQALAQLQVKVAPLIGGLATGISGTINDVGANKGGVLAGLWQNTKDTAKIVGGGIMEMLASLAPEGSVKAKEFGERGTALRRSVTENTNSDDIASRGTSSESPIEKLIRELQEQASTDAWYEAVGGNIDWSASSGKAKSSAKAGDVSDLRQIGGYMTRGPSTTAAEEQLRLINRKMDDLVSTGKALTL